MDNAADDDVDQFDAMESEELYETSLRIVVWIEGALNKRDDVSRDTVREMLSDLVRDDLIYLRDKVRRLYKRTKCIDDTNDASEAGAPRPSARGGLLRLMENDPRGSVLR